MLRIHLHEAHIGFKQVAGSKRTTQGNIKTNDIIDTSPLKKKKKNSSQDLVDKIEAMDDNELSTSLKNFTFSKVSKSEHEDVAKKTIESDLLELSKRQDEKVLNKRRLEEVEELKLSKRKEDDDLQESNNKKSNSTRRKKIPIRKTNKGKELYNTIQPNLENKDSNIKELPEIVKNLIEEPSFEYVITGDGPCLIRTTAAHIKGDQDDFVQLARDLNTHEAEYREKYVKLIEADFPMTVTIGVNGETKTFNKGQENEFFDWLVDSKKGIFMWRNCIYVIALCNLTKTEIDILVLDESKSKAEKFCFKPDDKFKWNKDDKFKPNFEGERLNGKMTVLNYKNSHFNLIIDNKHALFEVGSHTFQKEKANKTKNLVETLFGNSKKVKEDTEHTQHEKQINTDKVNEHGNDIDEHIHCIREEHECVTTKCEKEINDLKKELEKYKHALRE